MLVEKNKCAIDQPPQCWENSGELIHKFGDMCSAEVALVRLPELLANGATALFVQSKTRIPNALPSTIMDAAHSKLGQPFCVNSMWHSLHHELLIATPHDRRPLDTVSVQVLEAEVNRLLNFGKAKGEFAEISIQAIVRLGDPASAGERLSILDELLDAVVNRKFGVQFQPIVQFANQQVYGHEALIRVPQSGILKKPGMFFRAADQARMVAWLDLACQERCFTVANERGMTGYLFINMDAEGLAHLHDGGISLAAKALEAGVPPNRVVLEITERQTVDDFPRLVQYIEQLRGEGFKIAVDDAGSGYSSLQTIAELKPDFVKIDRSVVRCIQDNGPRRALISTLTRFAGQVGASIIAEGCETRDELAALIELGVQFGQGYLLGKPDDGFKGLRREMREFVSERLVHRQKRVMGASYSIERMARKGISFDVSATLAEAWNKFRKFPDMDCAAVVENEHVFGLLTRSRLVEAMEKIGSIEAETIRGCVDLYPLTIEAGAPIESAAILTTYRNAEGFQDDIIVTQNGAFVGLVPVRVLMESLINYKVNSARYAHPVTGMSGMPQLEDHFNARLALGERDCLIHLEAAYLRPFNRNYGMNRGDDLLREAAQFLREVITTPGLCIHSHGNDFVASIHIDQAALVGQKLMVGFGVLAARFHSDEDRRRGYMEAVDAAGVVRRIPLVTLKVWTCAPGSQPFSTFTQAWTQLKSLRTTTKPTTVTNEAKSGAYPAS